LLSKLLRNLSVLMYDMSVQQLSIIKIKNSNLFLSKRYISHAFPPSEIIFLSEFTSATFPLSQLLTVITLKARLPFSNQSEASKFDNTNMTQFVEEWDNIYKNYKIKIIKKTRRVPKYMTKIIGKYVRAQEKYEKRD
jgi:hypothetical protein